MKMAELFTPGPWTIGTVAVAMDDGLYEAPDEAVIYLDVAEAGEEGSIQVRGQNARADVHLIATAPELYAALVEAAESAVIAPDCDPDGIETEGDLRACPDTRCAEFGCMELKARYWLAALAKARGE